jgi:transposase
MGTQSGRDHYEWSRQRYASDLTDAEWAKVGPLIPPAKPGGNKRTVDVREIVNGVMYVLSTRCRWHAIPKDLPARSTVHDYLDRWASDGTLVRIHRALYTQRHNDGPVRDTREEVAMNEDQSAGHELNARHVSAPIVGKGLRRSDLRRNSCWTAPGPRSGK